MRIIEYSAAHGYRDTEAIPDWNPSTDFLDWLGLAGFDKGAQNESVSFREYEPSVHVYLARDGKPTADGWLALVDVSFSGEGSDFVVVRSLSDCFQLRLLLAPVHLLGIGRYVAEVGDVLPKLFHAIHGHDVGEACDACDPEAAAAFRRRSTELAAFSKSLGDSE